MSGSDLAFRNLDASPDDPVETCIRAELDAFERRYGVPSERRFEVFDDADRCGDEELVRWSELYDIWRTGQPLGRID